MVTNADRIGGPTTSNTDSRITKPGAFIRRNKLDEVSQLINVLIGDMSIVGPRPMEPERVTMADPVWQATLSVRPGLLSFAIQAVRGRNPSNPKERIVNLRCLDKLQTASAFTSPCRKRHFRKVPIHGVETGDAFAIFDEVGHWRRELSRRAYGDRNHQSKNEKTTNIKMAGHRQRLQGCSI